MTGAKLKNPAHFEREIEKVVLFGEGHQIRGIYLIKGGLWKLI